MQDNEKVLTVLTESYLEDYIEILGISVSIIGYYPLQADSQIRNAITHLSRAIVNPADEDDEITKAKRHIERAKRDCLKLALLGKREHISDHIKSIRYAKGGLPEDVMVRRVQIELDQKKALINEARGMDINPELENVLAQMLELEDELFKFDKIAFQPSKLVYYATKFLSYLKWILVTVGTISVGIIIREIIIKYF